MATETANWGYLVQPADDLVSLKLEALPENTKLYHTLHVQIPPRSAIRLAQQLLESALVAGVK